MESAYPLVSVIIPVYNSGDYLEACLTSVVSQTYQHVEIISVNDGSTDRSPEIMESFASKDKRIITLSQPNRGVSAARNAGLRVAKGEYVLFVDSDDTIRNDTVEILCRQAVSTGADIVLGNVYYSYPDGKQVQRYQRPVKYAGQPLQTGAQCFSQLIEDSLFPPLVYLYFTKRSFILENRLFFKEGIVHEDELWCTQVLVLAPGYSSLISSIISTVNEMALLCAPKITESTGYSPVSAWSMHWMHLLPDCRKSRIRFRQPDMYMSGYLIFISLYASCCWR